MAYKRKTLKRAKTQRRRKSRSYSRKVHGGCKDGNCLFQAQQQPLPASLPHSNFSQNGGQFQPSFSNVPLRSFYPLNTYQSDPSREMVSTTQHSLKGGNKGGKKSRRQRRQQRGGLGASDLFSYGASVTPSNITNLGFHNSLNRPYA